GCLAHERERTAMRIRFSSRVRLVCCAALVTCASVACRPQPKPGNPFEGTWVMTLEGRPFIVLSIEKKGDSLAGQISHPKTFELPQGKKLRFSHVEMPVKTRAISRITVDGSHLHLVVDDPDNPNEPDEYDFTVTSANQAALQVADVPVPVPSFPFTRS